MLKFVYVFSTLISFKSLSISQTCWLRICRLSLDIKCVPAAFGTAPTHIELLHYVCFGSWGGLCCENVAALLSLCTSLH